MNKFLAIFFLFTFLNAYTVFGEALKLPILIYHFVEYSQEDKNAKLIDFLAEHYVENIGHQHQVNHQSPEKLPFKAIDNFSMVISVVLPPTVVISVILIVIAELRTSNYSQQIYSNTYLNSIWHPPRFS